MAGGVAPAAPAVAAADPADAADPAAVVSAVVAPAVSAHDEEEVDEDFMAKSRFFFVPIGVTLKLIDARCVMRPK